MDALVLLVINQNYWYGLLPILAAIATIIHFLGKLISNLFHNLNEFIGDLRRMIWEHDQMWVDYCIAHKIPITTIRATQANLIEAKKNGEAKAAHSGDLI